MNNEGDIECTCDVGVFASCPACREARLSEATKTKPDNRPDARATAIAHYYRALRRIENEAMDERIQEIARNALLESYRILRGKP